MTMSEFEELERQLAHLRGEVVSLRVSLAATVALLEDSPQSVLRVLRDMMKTARSSVPRTADASLRATHEGMAYSLEQLVDKIGESSG